MKFYLDTEDYDNTLSLKFTEAENTTLDEVLDEFSIAAVTFFTKLCMKLGCPKDHVPELSEYVLGEMDNMMNNMLEDGTYESYAGDIETEHLRAQMEASGKSDDFIEQYLDMVRRVGGPEKAREILERSNPDNT